MKPSASSSVQETPGSYDAQVLADAAVPRDEVEAELADVARLDLAHLARDEVVVEELHAPDGTRTPAAATKPRWMRSGGVHHVDLVVSSLERSLPFYRELLGPLGWHGIGEVEGERGETIWYLSGRETSIGLREAQSEPGAVDRYARRAAPPRVRGAVAGGRRRARRVAARDGAVLESEPQEYTYMPGYYAVFFYDPDGLKLEILTVSPSRPDPRGSRTLLRAGSCYLNVARGAAERRPVPGTGTSVCTRYARASSNRSFACSAGTSVG